MALLAEMCTEGDADSVQAKDKDEEDERKNF